MAKEQLFQRKKEKNIQLQLKSQNVVPSPTLVPATQIGRVQYFVFNSTLFNWSGVLHHKTSRTSEMPFHRILKNKLWQIRLWTWRCGLKYLRQLEQNNFLSWFMWICPSSPTPQMASSSKKRFRLNFSLEIGRCSSKQLEGKSNGCSAPVSRKLKWNFCGSTGSVLCTQHHCSSTVTSINSVRTNNLKCDAGKIDKKLAKRYDKLKDIPPYYYYLSNGC